MRPETRALLAYLDRVEPVLDELSHFEMLDIEPSATDDDIQRAYHAVAARMHPDRHRAFVTPQQYERLNIVYGRIAEAYRCLRNPKEREHYARGLAAHKGADVGSDIESSLRLLTPKAQRHYRRAQVALRARDRASAILNLKMALRENPTSALLRDALAELQKPK